MGLYSIPKNVILATAMYIHSPDDAIVIAEDLDYSSKVLSMVEISAVKELGDNSDSLASVFNALASE